jgi:hypothetical protein
MGQRQIKLDLSSLEQIPNLLKIHLILLLMERDAAKLRCVTRMTIISPKTFSPC